MLDILCPAGDPGSAAGKDGSRMLRREAGTEVRGGAGGAHSGQVLPKNAEYRARRAVKF